MSFSTLLATSAAEFNFWPGISNSTGIHAGILYLLIPLILVCANAFKIEVQFNHYLQSVEYLGRVSVDNLQDLRHDRSHHRVHQADMSCDNNMRLDCH